MAMQTVLENKMRLKSWESPRSGRRRNDKSKQASARVRQLKKQTQQLRKRLKQSNHNAAKPPESPSGGFVLMYKTNSH
jgi:hypothetical protein